MHRHSLDGCRVTPISNYVKAIGVFGVLHREDPKTTACWKNDGFVIKTGLDREGLLQYMLERYDPSPIMNPWSYNTHKKTVKLLKELTSKDRSRYAMYGSALTGMDMVLSKFKMSLGVEKVEKKIVDENKGALLKMCRNYMPDEFIPWLDAVCVIGEKYDFSPILGTGGNDGHYDMAENFAKSIVDALEGDHESSRRLLEASLFGSPTELRKNTNPGHNTEGGGGPNFDHTGKGNTKSMSNPWDNILMMEGMLLFAGNTSRQLSSSTNKAMFPFTAGTSNIGYDTPSMADTGEGKPPESKGEVWVPVWENFAPYPEIRHMFNEGRIQMGKRQARSGTEFARAIMTFGSQRGVSAFQRFCILKRKGKAYLTVSANKIRVEDKPTANLLEDIDGWYDRIDRKIKKMKTPPESLLQLKQKLDGAIMEFCSSKDQRLAGVLVHIGRLERYVSTRKDYQALPYLSRDWLEGAYDGSAEFRLAAAMASIRSEKIGDIRCNLESVTLERGQHKHAQDSTGFVWNEDAGLLRNVAKVIQRRSVDGHVRSAGSLQIEGIIDARIPDVMEFLYGNLDMQKISDLVLPLSMVRIDRGMRRPWGDYRADEEHVVQLPEAYRVIKLIYPPRKEECIPYDTTVLSLLHAGRTGEAFSRATAILRAHGMPPQSNNEENPTTVMPDNVKENLLAALIFPIPVHDRKKMIDYMMGQDGS